MSPMDIEQLIWDEFLVHPAVDTAYNDLIKLADRPVTLHDRALVPKVPQSFRIAWSGGIHIFLDVTSPRSNHSLVHELLHEILTAEKYCIISKVPPVISNVNNTLSNEMQHPEIFRRMADIYQLEMDSYWDHWHKEMRREVDTMKDQAIEPDYWLGHFPRLYTWFFQEVSSQYLAEYAAKYPRVYSAVEAAAKETAGVGFRTARKHRRCMEIFRQHWLRFCERDLPRSPYGSPPHTLIEATEIRPIIERDKATTASGFMSTLRLKGYLEG